MNILVCIKQVPDTTIIKIDPETNTLMREGVPAIVSPFDAYALEAAARIKDKDKDTKIVVLSMGPEQALAALKECLSVGGDKAYLVSDRACGGSDTLATGYILSKAKEKIEELEGIKFDMLMFGKQAIDGDTAQVGPQVAEDLDIPQVTYAWEVWPTEDGKSVRVKKELEEGFEILEMACPCAVTVTKPDYEPRFPTIKSKMAANKAKIPVLSAADCGLDVERSGLKGSPTKVKKSFTPPRKEGGLKIKEETPEESAKKLYDLLKDKVDFYFDSPVTTIAREGEGYRVTVGETDYTCDKCIVSVGRVGSKWMEGVCQELKIPTKSNRVDIGVRVEIPAVVFSHLTDELYESKIVYRTEKFEDNVRTFCMNPNGIVVNENTNGIVTVNGHSYEDKSLQTENTNFALLVAKHFSEPFKDSNGYGESIARLSNMLGGGVIVQRFGDLVRGRRSTVKRIEEGLVTPTLAATPGDLSLVLPKRILDGIIEMIYALDKIAPGTANDDTLLYGVEVKFYNMEVALDEHLETPYKGLYVIGDGSGITHSLSHASASGVYVAREILETV